MMFIYNQKKSFEPSLFATNLIITLSQLSLYLICTSIIILALNSTWVICDTHHHDQQKANGSGVRVLLVKSLEQENILEKAASLSVDLPAVGPTRQQELARQQTNQNSSLGYQQVSLASLTLHQPLEHSTRRKGRQSSKDENSPQDQEKSEPNPQVPKQTNHDKEAAWSELYLPRMKPSWLNVSSQFRITSSSIEELDTIHPVEFMLRPAFDSPILLKTKLGILEGVRSIKFNKHLYTFLSVPYAKPPINELRFKPPQPIERWEGIMQATKWPPFCVQPSMTLASKSSPVHVLAQMMTEDCLYMNIWTPSLRYNRNRKRPVMVWIHGGAFQYGGISVDENDGSALALLGDVVVVTMNYRISAFGFLNANNPENGANNVGLLDQQMAMQWVQANIKQFGGDPQQVTLFGESAGGHSVGLHMISPKSQLLFKRAILQSGVPISFLRSYDINTDNKGPNVVDGIGAIMMAKRLKCFKTDDMRDQGNELNSLQNETTITPITTTTMSPPESSSSLTLLPPSTTMDVSYDNSTMASGGTELDSDSSMAVLSDETLDCMRNKSSLEILKAMGAPGNAGFFPTGNDQKGFFPNGFILESFDPDNLKVGPQKDYLIGTNTDEGTFMLHYGMPSIFPSKDIPKVDNVEALKEALKAEIEKLSKESELSLNNSEIASASGHKPGGAQAHLYKPLLRLSTSILESFMPKSHVRVLENGTVVGNTTTYNKQAEFGKNIASLITDIIFLCPARSLARTLSESGRNVYFYLYTHRSSLSQYHEWLGVTHHDEVEFVFGRPLRLADVYSGKDIEMSQRMIKIWAHFAYTGQMLDQFNLKWPKYGEEENNYMALGADHASLGERYHDKFCNIYDTVISVHLQDT